MTAQRVRGRRRDGELTADALRAARRARHPGTRHDLPHWRLWVVPLAAAVRVEESGPRRVIDCGNSTLEESGPRRVIDPALEQLVYDMLPPVVRGAIASASRQLPADLVILQALARGLSPEEAAAAIRERWGGR